MTQFPVSSVASMNGCNFFINNTLNIVLTGLYCPVLINIRNKILPCSRKYIFYKHIVPTFGFIHIIHLLYLSKLFEIYSIISNNLRLQTRSRYVFLCYALCYYLIKDVRKSRKGCKCTIVSTIYLL